jgi:hypothetical protein
MRQNVCHRQFSRNRSRVESAAAGSDVAPARRLADAAESGSAAARAPYYPLIIEFMTDSSPEARLDGACSGSGRTRPIQIGKISRIRSP